MIDTLIINGTVITMNGERQIIEDGAVAIDSGKILAVGPTSELLPHYAAGRIIDGSRKIVMPGLIDGHAHAGHGLVKTIGCDDADLWYKACELIYTQGSTADFWYAESRLSALERLKNGTTFGVSYLGGGHSFMATDDPQFGDAYCRGVDSVGNRAMLAVGPGGPPFPRHYIRFKEDKPVTHQITHGQMLRTSESLIQQWHGQAGGKIDLCLTFPTPTKEAFPPGSDTFEDLKVRAGEARALSRKYGLLWTMDGHHTDTIRFAHEALDLLGPDSFLSHCIDITPEEIEICAQTGTKIAHNPSAVFSIMGRCPVPELLDAGVTVMICSDGTAPDRSYDMFRHMWQAMHYHRRQLADPQILPPGKALEMVTIDAARALGKEEQLGSLEVGKQADIVLVDMHKPHLYPLVMPVNRLVYFAKGSDVDTVLVAGDVLVEGGRATQVDEDEIMDQAQTEALLALERTGLHHWLERRAGFWGNARYPDRA